jgi:hypothetical protein
MAITQLLGFATQVLGLALLACQHYTDFWPTSWLYKEQEREREREHIFILLAFNLLCNGSYI